MSTYNRVVAADETASLAPTVRARLATEMADPTSEVGAAGAATFATLNASNSFNDEQHFDQPEPAGGASGGFTSHKVDATTGAPVAGQIVMKSATKNSGVNVIDWSHNDTTSTHLFHLVLGVDGGGALIALGVDYSNGTGLLVSNKADGLGVGLNNEATSTGVGFHAGNFGTGKLIDLQQGSATAGDLLNLRPYPGATSKLLKWTNAAGTVDLGWIATDGSFHLVGGGQPHEVAWDLGSGYTQKIYTDTGSGTWWATALVGSINSLLFQAGSAAAAKGSETLQTVIEIKGAQRLGFYGATATSKPTGVAVTAAGVHAALVTLGLIAA